MITAVILLGIAAVVAIAAALGPDTRDTRYSMIRRREDDHIGRCAPREFS